LGNTYETNDHVALQQDLRTIHTHGFRVVPLRWIVEWVLGRRDESAVRRSVAITFDDGPDYDFDDLTHPHHGVQRSFYNILRDFQAEFGVSAQPHLHASSFVIASPAARRQLDARELGGLNRMTDRWWQEAEGSGLIDIYNHSWDHNHSDVTSVCEERQIKGSFEAIDTDAECRCEVLQSARFIHQQIRPVWPTIFAYPWGQSSPYLREVCLPSFQDRHHALAAFGTSGTYVTSASPRWNLPRFVSSADWRNAEELMRILNGAR
jgi:peptidoglycan/xylan/chitin deacetylase (PgdA/CDA1 family)